MSYIKRVVLLLFLAFNVHVVRADALIDLLQEGDAMAHASVGVYVMDVESGHVPLSHNAHHSFVPASLVKLLTAASVLHCYDDSTRWDTSVYCAGEVVDSVLYGDIVVKGSIDPSLDNECAEQPCDFVPSVVCAVQEAGIKTVSGSIIVDASCSEMGGWGEWMAEDLGLNYGAPCYGVNYRGNDFDVLLSTSLQGSEPQVIGTTVDIPMLRIHNYLSTGAKDSSAVYSLPYATDCMLMGKVPALRDTFAIECAMPDPPLVLAYELTEALHMSGVAIDGEPLTDRILGERNMDMPAVGNLLYNRKSDELACMLREMMYESNNLYAEAMLRYIAMAHDTIARTSHALQCERAMWGEMGLDTLAVHVTDGCGLSRKNRVTPHFMASFLAQAYHSLGDSYLSLLPRAGKDGTLRSLFRCNPLPGVLRLKSGSMSGVMCYAGYYSYQDKVYAVVLMSNHHGCKASEVRRRYEQLLRGIPAFVK